MARKKKSGKTVETRDLGTPETRRRVTSDPLLSSDIEPHRLQAALAIRAALEDGLSAPGLDMVRIGMGGGALSGDRSFIPTTPANIENRTCHGRWVQACRAADLEHYIFELFAVGHSLRQIAAHVHLRRSRCADIVDRGLDIYADLRGFRRHPRLGARVAAWEVPVGDQPIPDPEPPIFAMPVESRLRKMRSMPILTSLTRKRFRSSRIGSWPIEPTVVSSMPRPPLSHAETATNKRHPRYFERSTASAARLDDRAHTAYELPSVCASSRRALSFPGLQSPAQRVRSHRDHPTTTDKLAQAY
ncbi:MAG TPA: hypothetical protein VGN93_04445 [Shinella sp.]|uniref:hypothetical protein n=1 Tax=Shinella sp. TaxID=1870904 RepID=UPI002E10E502|nr:hypothetical protein [Shinella sp.]